MPKKDRNVLKVEEPYTKELRNKIRAYVAENGRPFDKIGLPYGWSHYAAERHIYGQHYQNEEGEGCEWVVPEGVTLTEETYSMFAGTEASNDQEVGINVTGAHCKCGKFTDVTLRCSSPLSEILAFVLGVPEAVTEIKL